MVLCVPLGPSYSPSCSPRLPPPCLWRSVCRQNPAFQTGTALASSTPGRFLPPFFLCIVILSQILTRKNTHNDCFISRLWQTRHAIVERLYTMLPFCSNCYTNAKTQGYCLVSGCFSRAKTLTFFFFSQEEKYRFTLCLTMLLRNRHFLFSYFPHKH